MKRQKIIVSAIFFLSFGYTKLQAQEAANTAGGNASGSGGTASYSIGQTVYTTNSGTNGSVAQGVQQAYEISIVTGLESASGINLSFFVYPNPATDFLKLNVGDYKIQNLSLELCDISGKVLEIKKMETSEAILSMVNNASGIYFLKVIENNKELKTFKIIKN